jgi:hypothetical protein
MVPGTPRVYDVSGRVVRALVDESRAPGAYRVNWNGCDAQSRRVASGACFYRLDAGEFSATRKTVPESLQPDDADPFRSRGQRAVAAADL